MISTRILSVLVAAMAVLSITIQSVPVKHNITSLKQCNFICEEQDYWCKHASGQMEISPFDCPAMLARCRATCESQFQ
ncbi:MAG: hypothetical protein JOS17DRAFT_796690 [Linnemannia elongata]|nr:MAG: hypothetical protein JOS17DRAFT_796690 [Linnemannia elongata]